jgi:hypothetical protein
MALSEDDIARFNQRIRPGYVMEANVYYVKLGKKEPEMKKRNISKLTSGHVWYDTHLAEAYAGRREAILRIESAGRPFYINGAAWTYAALKEPIQDQKRLDSILANADLLF